MPGPGLLQEYIKSLVRPGFSTSRIYTSPPSNTEFLERYEVQRSGGRIMPITIYRLTDRPESLYFTIPGEYNNMHPIELEIIESVQEEIDETQAKEYQFCGILPIPGNISKGLGHN